MINVWFWVCALDDRVGYSRQKEFQDCYSMSHNGVHWQYGPATFTKVLSGSARPKAAENGPFRIAVHGD
jgi:hypothetical protein